MTARGGTMRFGVHHLNTYFPELDGTQSAMYRHLFEQGVLLQAWSDAPVSFHGQLYNFENVRVLPKPVQRPHPPVWVGASRSDDTFRWAGEKGFNLMTLPFTYEPPVMQHWVEVYKDTLRE